ncbi:uncharacterized protein LOC129953225 [Eupeodes corollae]|uniref:uncharacterized protein LOC129953225 n=1 Tax=Eupeodes corollae TaxID=290404 RepID=UPI00248FE46C|nr:uncharacterized protein LOC129953225 [Eupeodes corollae]
MPFVLEPVIYTNNHQLQDQNIHNSILDNNNETARTQFLKISSKSPDECTSINNGRFFQLESFDIRPLLNLKDQDYFASDGNADAVANDDERDDVDIDSKEANTLIGNDKARHNLATRVMANGVEVIIAGDKNGKVSAKRNVSKIPPSMSSRPLTLAPSTLQDQMILVMPSNSQEKFTIPIDSKQFITKTCLTTYTYRTTYLQDDKTTVESQEKVVSNTATEERNYLKIKPTETLGITLSRTPELAVGVFHTTYTYFNTILKGEHSIVVSSKHILTNTITGPDDYISFLQPSGEATPVFETNTYYSKISFTKTLKESNLEKVVSTSNILTQVIVTESFQPLQGSSIITSYVAFDIDDTTAKNTTDDVENSLLSNNQLLHTYEFHTNDDKVKKQNLELKNNRISSVSIPPTSLTLELLGSLKTDIYIYATKTYLTTFTYFTTLMNSNTTGNIDSSTVVSFHTRIIENVITESIPSVIINTDLLSAFQTQLKNPQNQNSFVTMITLTGGQSLEITAMNMIHPSLSYNKNQATKVYANGINVELNSLSSGTQLPFENSNEIFDSDVSSSENEELFTDQYLAAAEVDTGPITQNNTKTVSATPDIPSMNKIIGSFNLHSLQALGPVFNAMAGLIQNNLNNFGTSPNANYDIKTNSSTLGLERKQVTKNMAAYINNSIAVDHSHERPIYIPVKISPYKHSYLNPEKKLNYAHQNLDTLSPESNGWYDSKLNHNILESGAGTSLNIGKSNYETPLLNGGIPISPGEVITANSDVIVGKPNGIKPHVPYGNKHVNKNVNPLPLPPSLSHITPYSYQFQYQHVKAGQGPKPLPESPLNFDRILKPPSVKQHSTVHQQKHIPPHVSKNPYYRAHYATSHMHHPFQDYAQKPPIHMPHLPQRNHAQWPSNAQRLKPTYIPYTLLENDQQYLPRRDNNNDHQVANLSNLTKNEVLEIKRIPEVFSTNLPASETNINNQNKNFNGTYKKFLKNIINSEKPMLVDIQPSKITNIIIPSDDSASILVVESSVELHKNGQYYDEPTTYSDAFMTGSVALASSLLSSANQPHKPISSNQQINLDMNVLNHNVDINVPPITFNKDAEFPHTSSPVRGYFQEKEQFVPFKMPHVKIPLSDNQIQVNLTPQNFITQNISSVQFVSKANVDNVKLGIEKSTTETQSLYYNNVHQQPYQRPFHENLKPLESKYYQDTNNSKNKPNSSSFDHLKTNYHPYTHVIPIRDNNNSLNSLPKLTSQRPIQLIEPLKYQKETLNIFAKVTPAPIQELQSVWNKQENYSQRRKPSAPIGDQVSLEPLLHNSSKISQSKNSNHNLNYPTDESNRLEDQKSSSSLNIAVPVNKPKEVLKPVNYDTNEDDLILEMTSSSLPISQPNNQAQKQTHFNKSLPTTTNNIISSVENFTTFFKPLSLGKPFVPATSKIIKKPIPLKGSTNISREVLKNGEGFKLHQAHDQLHKGFEQPIKNDSSQQQNKNINNFHQTEAPFNPKYTQITTKPQITDKYVHSTTTSDLPLTQILSLNQMEVLNNYSKVNGKDNISHNHHIESTEIFDFHESVNPHNYKFINTESQPTIKISKEKQNLYSSTNPMTIYRIPTLKSTKTRYQMIHELSTDMQPPSADTSSIKPQTEKVMGLNPPPPLPSSKLSMPLQLPTKTASSRPPASSYNFKEYSGFKEKVNQNPAVLKQFDMTTIKTTATNSIKKDVGPKNTSTLVKYESDSSKLQTKLKPKSKLSTNSINTTETTRKPNGAHVINKSSSTSATTVKSIIPDSKTETAISIVFPTINSSSSSSTLSPYSVPLSYSTFPTLLFDEEETFKTISPTGEEGEKILQKSTSYFKTSNSSKDTSPLLTNKETPEQFFIEESEEHNLRQPQITDSRFKENRINKTLVLTSKKSSAIVNQQSKLKQQHESSNAEFGSYLNDFNIQTQVGTRRKNPDIFSTKFIKWPHYLTVTTTKLSIPTSHGVPITQTLTLTLTETKTSTLVDTVTETHTLLQPTRILESQITTVTQTLHYEDYHKNHHPFRTNGKVEPTINVFNNVLLTSSEFDGSNIGSSAVPAIDMSQSSSITTTTKTFEPKPKMKNDIKNLEPENNSIFVVMSDKNSQGEIISINPSFKDLPQNINSFDANKREEIIGIPEVPSSIELDYDYNITFDYLPTRDEEAEENEVNHVLLGGVLIATPPKSNNNDNEVLTPSTYCQPTCKPSRNELCQKIDNRMQCLCRPGFGRIFPDRPCRPTYTYTLEIPIYRINSQVLHFNDQYHIRDSDYFKQLADITRNAVDRMIMQSDLRDVYHGVHVTSFDFNNVPGSNSGILGTFLIQLSDNSDEKRLVDVFKKYLRQNNFNLGGTEIFTTKDGVNLLQVTDFNECAHNQFHDCSVNSKCFNLQGTYTCSCQDGFVDLSENSIYPGRICSTEIIGCEKCYFHGKCVQSNKTNQNVGTVCECFTWYTGASCQLNLKIVFIALITIGTILFILLLLCILITCTRRRDNHNMQSFMSGMQIIAPKISSSSKTMTIDKRAMIKDSSSEGSQNSLPYVLKRDVEKNSILRSSNHINQTQHNYMHQSKNQKPTKIINQRGHPSSPLFISPFSEIEHQRHNFPEQSDRSLTVMIPRAKYHHSVLGHTPNPPTEGIDLKTLTNEVQLKNVSPDTSGSTLNTSTFQCRNDKISSNNTLNRNATINSGIVVGSGINHQGSVVTKSTGALVSAGFEVSATVGNLINRQQQQSLGDSTINLLPHVNRGCIQSLNSAEAVLKYNNYRDEEKLTDSMDFWIDIIQQKKLAPETRCFNETTIQAPSKSVRCVYERQLSQSNGNDEANTMAERDVGSTCLLPHTHLYKPDRDSDVSGFDSL